MLNKILEWSSHYAAYPLLNNDLLIVTCEEEFLFPYEKYPLLHLIDGKTTVQEIADQSHSVNQSEQFLFLINQMLTKSDFLKVVSPNTFTGNLGHNIRPQSLRSSVSLLSSDYDHLALNIDEVLKSNCSNTQFMLAHNFMSKPLIHHLKTLDPAFQFSVIIISNSKVLISPRFNCLSAYFKFTERLEHNSPVAKTFKSSILVNFTRPFPPCLQPNASKVLESHFSDLLQTHTESNFKNLTELKLTSSQIIEHKYIPFDDLKNNIDNAITLQSRPHSNSKDGGSRCIKAEHTVEKVMPFVSPYTGIITHIEPLGNNVNSPITIFQTSFFKTLPHNKIHTIKDDSFVQVCLGKGVSKAQSMASALCEAIERKNAQFVKTDTLLKCDKNSLDSRAYSFEQNTFYSKNQFNVFASPNCSKVEQKISVKPYDNSEIHWQPVWSLSHNEPVYVPTVLCFANTPFEDDKFGKWQSNGCAAGNNLEEAILQALFELIERDATAIWWYNKLERPSFDLTRLDPDYLSPLDQTLNKDHNYWVLDLTVDTGVPVMAAIGRHKQSKGLIFGFGCHLKPEMAAQRALTELCQLIPIRNQNGAPFDFDAIEPGSYLFANDQAPRGNYALTETLDIKDDILAVVERLKCLNLETLALDYTRPPIPIHTAKVFVPGLCHIWPQLGNKRLYDTPVKLGWLDEPLNEQTINQQGLYI